MSNWRKEDSRKYEGKVAEGNGYRFVSHLSLSTPNSNSPHPTKQPQYVQCLADNNMQKGENEIE